MQKNRLTLAAALVVFGVAFTATKAWNASGQDLGTSCLSGSAAPVEKAMRDLIPAVASTDGMVWIAGDKFTMGTDSELGWPDEKPAHVVRVKGFWIDPTEVTNTQFRQFIAASRYVTTAEQVPDVTEIMQPLPPGTPPPQGTLSVGSLVFTTMP